MAHGTSPVRTTRNIPAAATGQRLEQRHPDEAVDVADAQESRVDPEPVPERGRAEDGRDREERAPEHEGRDVDGHGIEPDAEEHRPER